MRRLTSIFLVPLLAGLLCTGALAAGSAEIVRAFVYEGTLYTYVSMEEIDQPITKAEAKLGGRTFQATDRLETVRQAGTPVTWLLLVDNSNSMPAFRQEVEDFAQSLAQSGGENTQFILATFGDAFAVRAEDVPPEELPAEMEQIPFDERVTRLHTAISQGLDYFEGLPRQRGELRCIVVLSDGVQYDPTGGVSYEELLERVGTSDVMLHSVGLGGDREALDSMGRLAEASGGSHQMMEEVTAAEAGSALAEDSGRLFVTGFDLSGLSAEGGTEQVSVTFAAGSELICRAEGQVELPKLTGEGGTGSNVQPSVPLPKPSTQTPGGAGGGTASPTDSLTAPLAVPLIGGIAAIVLVMVAAAVLLTRRKRRISEVSSPVQEEQVGIYMRLELVRGGLASGQNQKELELRDELIIGTDPLCDIVVQDGEAVLRHVRLFSVEGAVYVEALDFSGAVQINGEGLQESRRLRSGDEVTVGSTVIRLKF